MKSYEKINVREAQVACQKFSVWSDFIARATFAENADGVVKAIRTNGYIHNELTVRKAIAVAFELPTFRKQKEDNPMKKADLVAAILEDMCSKNPGKEKTIILEWRPWLNRQHKFYLEKIYNDRRIGK